MNSRTLLAEEFVKTHPEAAARILEEQSPAHSSFLVDAIADELSVKALSSMLPHQAARCLEQLDAAAAAKYLHGLRPKTAAAILRRVESTHRFRVLKATPSETRIRLRRLLRYARTAVGAHTDPMILTVAANATVGEALTRYRRAEGIEHPTVYVVDAEHMPLAEAGIATLLRADAQEPVTDFATPVTHKLKASTPLDTALAHGGWKRADSLPVVDRAGGLLGVIHHADLRRNAPESPLAENRPDQDAALLDLTNLVYLGMADLIGASLSAPPAAKRAALGGSRR